MSLYVIVKKSTPVQVDSFIFQCFVKFEKAQFSDQSKMPR